MLKLCGKLIKTVAKYPYFTKLAVKVQYSLKTAVAMAGVGSKMKAEFLEPNPRKRIKMECDSVTEKRTVATMCGAWRPEEEDGGLILVFKTRTPCLSPDPTEEKDFPENIEDFWEATLQGSDDIQSATNAMQKLLMAQYLISVVAQLFMFCWHSNDVLMKSDMVYMGPYESEWWSAGVRQRRSVLILLGQLRISYLFTAGPFSNLTLSTFITVLKGSYSYYTLLKK